MAVADLIKDLTPEELRQESNLVPLSKLIEGNDALPSFRISLARGSLSPIRTTSVFTAGKTHLPIPAPVQTAVPQSDFTTTQRHGSHPGLYLMIKTVGMRGRVLSFAPMARRGHLSIKNLRELLTIKEEIVNENHRQADKAQTRSHLPSMSHNKCTRSSSKGPSNSTVQKARGSSLR